MSDINEQIKEIKRLCILNFAEIQHLKKVLYEHLEVNEGGIYDFANSLRDYIEELDSKNRALVKYFPHLM